MDYSEGASDPVSGGWKAKLKWALVLIGGPLLLLIGVGGFAAWVGSPEEQFDRMIDSDASGKPMFVALRKHFPDEYGSFRRTLLPHVERGAKPQELTLITGEFMRGFNARHRWEVARAPAAELKAFMASQLSAFEKVSTQSPQACGDLAFGRNLPTGAVNKDNSGLISTMAVRFIEAAAAGRDNDSGRSGPSQADRQQLGKQLLAAGLRPDVRKLMERNAPPFTYTDDQMCYLSLNILRALTKLPSEVALRIEAEIVQTS